MLLISWQANANRRDRVKKSKPAWVQPAPPASAKATQSFYFTRPNQGNQKVYFDRTEVCRALFSGVGATPVGRAPVKESFTRTHEAAQRVFETSNATEFNFFKENLTKLSVAEMADQLKISEGEAYLRLSTYQIRVLEPFEKSVAPEAWAEINFTLESRGHRELSESSREMSVIRLLKHALKRNPNAYDELLSIWKQVFGYGEIPIDEVLNHYVGNKFGIAWLKTLNYGNHNYLKRELLVTLFAKGFTAQQIAETFNRIDSSSSGHTESLIIEQLEKLGLPARLDRYSSSSVYLPDYGYVKKSGLLVPTASARFIVDHYQHGRSWILEAIGVQSDALDRLVVNYGLEPLLAEPESRHRFRIKPVKTGNEELDHYIAQRQRLQIILRWLRENPKKLGLQGAFGLGSMEIHPDLDFRSDTAEDENFERTLKIEALKIGIPYSFMARSRESMSEQVRLEIQDEVTDLVVAWMVLNPGRSVNSEIFGKAKDIKVNFSRVVGESAYGKNGPQFQSRIFDSRRDLEVAVRMKSWKRGLDDTQILKVPHDITARMRLVMQETLTELVVLWLKENPNQHLSAEAFGQEESQISVEYQRAVGSNHYAEGRPEHDRRIFDSASDFLLAVKKRARQEGLVFRLLDHQIRRTTPLQKLIMREELNEFILIWKTGKDGVVLSQKHFGHEPGQIPVDWRKVVGLGEYAEGGTAYGASLYESIDQFADAMRTLGVEFKAARRGRQGKAMQSQDDEKTNRKKMTPAEKKELYFILNNPND